MNDCSIPVVCVCASYDLPAGDAVLLFSITGGISVDALG